MSDLFEQLGDIFNHTTNAELIRRAIIEAEIKQINLDYDVCPNCGGSPIEYIGQGKHCQYCDFYF